MPPLSDNPNENRQQLNRGDPTQREYFEALFNARWDGHSTALAALERFVVSQFASQREAVTAALAAVEKSGAAAQAAADRAVTKSESAYDKRFEAGNEIKGAMDANQKLMERTMLTKAEADPRFAMLEKDIQSLLGRMNARENREQGGTQTWALISAVIGVLFGLGGMICLVLAAFQVAP